MGLLGMEERATLIGGQLVIASSPGCGTTVTAHFPIDTSGSA
jgi:signal transduction histidine kinase